MRVAQELTRLKVLVSSLKQSSSFFWQVVFRAQSSLLDRPHLAHPTRTPSSLFPSHGDTPCDPRPGAQSGRLAEQSPFTSYEPNDLIEVNGSEATPILFQGRPSTASTYNPGEDSASTPMDSG